MPAFIAMPYTMTYAPLCPHYAPHYIWIINNQTNKQTYSNAVYNDICASNEIWHDNWNNCHRILLAPWNNCHIEALLSVERAILWQTCDMAQICHMSIKTCSTWKSCRLMIIHLLGNEKIFIYLHMPKIQIRSWNLVEDKNINTQ